MQNDLAYVGAVKALRLFRSREVSPVELLRAHVDRAAGWEPVINAFTDSLTEEAFAATREAERRYLGRGGGAPRPLEGIPVAVKETHAMAGLPHTQGSLVLRDVIAPADAIVVERLRAAGAVLHARTTQPEFGISTYTHSRLWGVTRNPWNPHYSPGGSSGGSAAALAAGTTTLATGSDIGGSLRIPAAFCGLVSFKPPHGRIAATGLAGTDPYRVDGPMARGVEDCALLQNVLTGPDPRDHHSLHPAVRVPAGRPVTGRRVALCVRLGDYPVHPDVEAGLHTVGRALTEAGADVVEVELPWTRERITHATAPHFAARSGAVVEEIAREHPDLINAYTAWYAERMAEIRAQADVMYGLRREVELQRELAEVMAGFDALVCPTTAVPAFVAGDDMLDGCVLDGVDLGPFFDQGMTIPFNMNSRLPVLAVPSGMSSYGLPTGVQIVGQPFDDATVFDLGRAVEEALPRPFTEGRRPVPPTPCPSTDLVDRVGRGPGLQGHIGV